MKILVTAGNTQALIDKVRCLTNIFTGRTGARLALAGQERGHDVILLTSHPELVSELHTGSTVLPYRTFAELQALMQTHIKDQQLDAVIHCAAVSDYLAAGIYAPAPGTHFVAENGHWTAETSVPLLLDRQAGKVKSEAPELWLRLLRAPKLVDSIRTDWGYRHLLVKFKLEVGVSDEELLRIAEKSRRDSAADLMVANTLEGASSYAYLGPTNETYQRVNREELAVRLLEKLEQLHQERHHG